MLYTLSNNIIRYKKCFCYIWIYNLVDFYSQDIEYIIDEAINEVKPEVWEDVKKKTKSKIECVKRAQEKAVEATRDINKLKDLISRYLVVCTKINEKWLFKST